MDSEFDIDIVTLVDEDGNDHDFEVIDMIENETGTFYALLPIEYQNEENLEENANYYIFEAIDENGETQLAEIENEELLDQLAEIFEIRFAEIYSEIEEINKNDADDLDEDE